MKLNKVLFLAAYTARSQSYAQAMLDAGLVPEYAVLFGKDSGPLNKTAKKMGSDVIKFSFTDVNSSQIINKIKELQPKLIIYSGYGGQIVCKDLLSIGVPVLHMHSGWLPDYRGSTTIYYSILEKEWCGVSAILLNSAIDQGMIVDRMKYHVPKKGMDIDYIYDGSIRANMLIKVLRKWIKHEKFSKLKKQTVKKGTIYYVIHPILKHLAILSLKSNR